jgi:hypothetical protein
MQIGQLGRVIRFGSVSASWSVMVKVDDASFDCYERAEAID